MESQIKSFKPNIKANTIKSYIGYYNRLHKALYDTPPMNMEWLDDVDKINEISKALTISLSGTLLNIILKKFSEKDKFLLGAIIFFPFLALK